MRTQLFGIVVLALVMVILPFHMRFVQGDDSLAGIEPYYHARAIASLSEGIMRDDSIVGGRQFEFNPYHVFMVVPFKLFGERSLSVFPVIFALLSVGLLFRLLSVFGVSRSAWLWMVLAFVLSPPWISGAFLATPLSFALCLILSGAVLFFGRWWWVGCGLLVVASLVSVGAAIGAIAFLCLVLLLGVKYEKVMVSLLLVMMSSIFSSSVLVTLSGSFVDLVSDFGGVYGLSLFGVLLSLIGFGTFWNQKRRYYKLFVLGVVFAASFILLPDAVPFVNLLVCFGAGQALDVLSRRKWKVGVIRSASLFVLFCGLLFSGISHTLLLSDLEPSVDFFDALDVPRGVVLSHEMYGFWIEAAGHKAVLDPLWSKLPDSSERFYDSRFVFNSVDVQRTASVLEKYGVDYVLITPQMEQGLVWKREGSGLSFLAQNSEMFKRTQAGSKAGVWKVD